MKEITIKIRKEFESDRRALDWVTDNIPLSGDYEVEVCDYKPPNIAFRFDIAGAPTKYLIWSVEHEGWWKGDRHGYSVDLKEAGLFEKDEAEGIVADANRIGNVWECMVPKGAVTQ